jgi:hypothetical protein
VSQESARRHVEQRAGERKAVDRKQWQAVAKLGSSRLELKPSRLEPREKRLARLGLIVAWLDRLAKPSQAAATLTAVDHHRHT